MLKNHNHDLIHQLSEASDSLWRIEDYIKNATGCDHCVSMWKIIQKDLYSHIDSLKAEIARHIKEDRFD